VATEASYKGYAALGEAELVQIKGAEEPVRAHRLLGIATGIAPSGVPRRIGSVGGDVGRRGVGLCGRWPGRGRYRGVMSALRQAHRYWRRHQVSQRFRRPGPCRVPRTQCPH